jgi:hypothetical protein
LPEFGHDILRGEYEIGAQIAEDQDVEIFHKDPPFNTPVA